MPNLDHLCYTWLHQRNREVDSEVEGRREQERQRGPGETGDIAGWASRFITGTQAQPNPWMLYDILMKSFVALFLISLSIKQDLCLLCLGHSGKVKKLKTKLFTYYISNEEIEKEGYNSSWRHNKKKQLTGEISSFLSFSCNQIIEEINVKGFDMTVPACQRERSTQNWEQSHSNKYSEPGSEGARAGCALMCLLKALQPFNRPQLSLHLSSKWTHSIRGEEEKNWLRTSTLAIQDN